jgi:hypothetical protein
MLALLARGQAAKDLQLMVLRTSSASSVARFHVPDWSLATVPCWPRSVEVAPVALVLLPGQVRHCWAGTIAWSGTVDIPASRPRATTAGRLAAVDRRLAEENPAEQRCKGWLPGQDWPAAPTS